MAIQYSISVLVFTCILGSVEQCLTKFLCLFSFFFTQNSPRSWVDCTLDARCHRYKDSLNTFFINKECFWISSLQHVCEDIKLLLLHLFHLCCLVSIDEGRVKEMYSSSNNHRHSKVFMYSKNWQGLFLTLDTPLPSSMTRWIAEKAWKY